MFSSAPSASSHPPIVTLSDLEIRIREECQHCETFSRLSLSRAIKVGELLLLAKGARDFELTDGFNKWVRQHCPFSIREAQRYMRLFKHRSILEKTKATRVSFWSLRGALQRINEELKRQAATQGRKKPVGEGEQEHEDSADPAAVVHIERCQKIKSLLRKDGRKQITEADLITRVAVEKRAFVDKIMAIAREFGQRLSNERFESAGFDADTIAMLLLRIAEHSLNPYEAFAPRRQKKRCSGRPGRSRPCLAPL